MSPPFLLHSFEFALGFSLPFVLTSEVGYLKKIVSFSGGLVLSLREFFWEKPFYGNETTTCLSSLRGKKKIDPFVLETVFFLDF